MSKSAAVTGGACAALANAMTAEAATKIGSFETPGTSASFEKNSVRMVSGTSVHVTQMGKAIGEKVWKFSGE